MTTNSNFETKGSFRDLLRVPGFAAFLWTQFLGAFNDNLFKMIVSVAAVELAAEAGRGSMYLALAGAVFVLPYLLFSGYAGHVADVFSKTRVLIVTKSFEILFMALGLGALVAGRIELLLGVLYLLAVQATFFSPAKYGIVPEILPARDLSRANALLEMTTFVAIVLGTSVGTFLFSLWKHDPMKMGLTMVVLAVVGSLTSLKIAKAPASGSHEPFRKNPLAEVYLGTKRLMGDRALLLTVAGVSFFWFLGALVQMDVLLFGREVLGVESDAIGRMVTCLAIGIGVGSLAAGKLSGDRVELGLAPVGAFGMALGAVAVAMTQTVVAAGVALAVLGFFGGLFVVPLNAAMQERGEAGEKGRVIATNNFYNTVGVLLASGMLTLLHDKLQWTASGILVFAAVLTAVGGVWALWLTARALVRYLLVSGVRSVYRLRIEGLENVPVKGGALLVANHVSYVDGLIVGAAVERNVRFLIYKPIYEHALLNWLFRWNHAIPAGGGSRRDAVETIQAARRELEAGHVVCIFPEGGITTSGNIETFKRGMEKIAEGLNVPVIPVHLDGLWGSVFSFSGGKFFWKVPKAVPYPVTVSFGEGEVGRVEAAAMRQKVAELGARAAEKREYGTLAQRLTKVARRNWFRAAVADSTGQELTFGRLLVAGTLVAGWLRRARGDERWIGLLLPASTGGVLANVGVTLASKTAVNLNYSLGEGAMRAAMGQCGIRTVVTSRRFLSKAKIAPMPEMVFLEEIVEGFTGLERVRAVVRALFGRVPEVAPVATVIFSSGSTSEPKGVMLTDGNILANTEAVAQVYPVGGRDCLVGVLPFFHSFGYGFTLWFPLLRGIRAAYHANPMDAKAIGELTARHKGTLLLATPTLCSTYARKVSKEEFATLRWVIVGAEKLRAPVAAAFQEKFGLRLLEGYGCTEMAPVVAVNTPDLRGGSVGRPLPGVAVKTDGEGQLLVRGANRMLGYLGNPWKTREVVEDGWYKTGDIGHVDEDGFVFVTDRVSRFSKIGGEMVPHGKVEETIAGVLGDGACVVVGVPDEQRGERLAVVYAHTAMEAGELWKKVVDSGLPNVWVPKKESYLRVEAVPVLGSGKVDLRRAKAMAEGAFRAESVL